MRPRTVRDGVQTKLREMLSDIDLPAHLVLKEFTCNRRTLRSALYEIGGHCYFAQGRWFYTLEGDDTPLSRAKRRIRRHLRTKGNISTKEAIKLCADACNAKYVRQAIRELRLKEYKIGKKIVWRLA